jgi:hypothetical protein
VGNTSIFRSDILPESGSQFLPSIPDAKPCEKQGSTEVKDGFFPILVIRFFEQDSEVKRELYSRELLRPLVYNSNFDLYSSPAACWRDTFFCLMAPKSPKPEDLPSVCRYVIDIIFNFSRITLVLAK